MLNDSGYKEFTGKDIYTGKRIAVKVQGERIQAVETLPDAEAGASGRLVVPEQEEVWIAPGLVDLQLNGFGGHDLNLTGTSSMEQRIAVIGQLVNAVLRSGTTSFCPTVITADSGSIADAMTAIRLACERSPLIDQSVAGVHLEGPYISDQDGARGAHPKEHARDPDWDEFMQWQGASGGRIKLVTLAPERAGALPFIEKLAASGILVSLGHTAADHEQIAAAIAVGARMSTHLGNGAHAMLPRHPNYIWSQLSEEQLWASVIADGHHLHSSVLKVMLKAKGDRLVLVSDAAHLAGLAPGKYKTHIGGEVELLANGRLQMAANPLLLAGSAVSLLDCVQGLARLTSAELPQAFEMAAEKPAGLLGAQGIGTLAPDYFADLILFRWNEADGSIELKQVVKRGRVIGK